MKKVLPKEPRCGAQSDYQMKTDIGSSRARTGFIHSYELSTKHISEVLCHPS